jgi:hypothetical protein
MALQMYEIETNVDGPNAKGEYFIKWEGYPDDQNTWEPLEHLPEDMVDEYLALELGLGQAGEKTLEGGRSLPVGLLYGCCRCLRGWWLSEVQPDKRPRQPSRDIVGCHGCCSSRGAHNKSARTRTSDAAARRAILVSGRLCSSKNVLRRCGEGHCRIPSLQFCHIRRLATLAK